MRLTILGLLLCTGIPAFCQSGTPPARDFGKLPPGWPLQTLHRRGCSSSPSYQPHAAWTMRKLIRK